MEKTMKDGTTAVLTTSGNYYVRQMYKGKSYNRPRKRNEKWDKIEYYDLKGNYIPLASIECEHCRELIQSQYCEQACYKRAREIRGLLTSHANRKF